MNYIIYLSYGQQSILNECLYSIMSIIKVAKDDLQRLKIIVYTDNAQAFQILPSTLVQIIPIDYETIVKYQGAFNFVFRSKIEMLIDASQRFDGKILYCDSDIYFQQSPLPLFEHLDANSFLMSKYEADIGNKKNKINKKILKFILRNKRFLNEYNLFLDRNTQMWNAGVIGFHTANAPVLNLVLKFTDIVCSRFTSHIIEQLAFSYYFSKSNKLQATENITFHYWNFKEYRQVLLAFFEYHHSQSSSLAKILSCIDFIRPDELIKPKLAYQSLAFWPKAFRKLVTRKNHRWQMPSYRLE